MEPQLGNSGGPQLGTQVKKSINILITNKIANRKPKCMFSVAQMFKIECRLWSEFKNIEKFNHTVIFEFKDEQYKSHYAVFLTLFKN